MHNAITAKSNFIDWVILKNANAIVRKARKVRNLVILSLGATRKAGSYPSETIYSKYNGLAVLNAKLWGARPSFFGV